jgi:formiminotetrahydrofolate cyclodeaminase
LAVALGEMTLNFTRGKKKFADQAELHNKLSARLSKAEAMFLDLIADDMEAYGMYRQASAMAEGPEKQAASALALAAAIDVPRQMSKLALAVLGDMLELANYCNKYLVSDLIAGAVLASATAALCDLNVLVNTPGLDDKQAAQDIRQASRDDRHRAAKLAEQLEEQVKDLLG